MKADWVSLKINPVREEIWRRINRPHGTLQLASILGGALEFAKVFGGEWVTETMLVEGVNDDDDHIREVAGFLARLRPATAYLAISTSRLRRSGGTPLLRKASIGSIRSSARAWTGWNI